MLKTDAPSPSVLTDWLLSEHGRDSVALRPSLSNPCKEESAYELGLLTAMRAGLVLQT